MMSSRIVRLAQTPNNHLIFNVFLIKDSRKVFLSYCINSFYKTGQLKMKKILSLCALVLCAGIFVSTEAHACINSKCKPCPDGFSPIGKCCSRTNESDCVFLTDEIEDCGLGQWKEYPRSVPALTRECCKNSTENNCRSTPVKGYCGSGEYKEYPYSPLKKCCKDAEGKDCIEIRAKKKCGKYQLKQYPVRKGDCCNSERTQCTGYVNDCPKCL